MGSFEGLPHGCPRDSSWALTDASTPVTRAATSFIAASAAATPSVLTARMSAIEAPGQALPHEIRNIYFGGGGDSYVTGALQHLDEVETLRQFCCHGIPYRLQRLVSRFADRREENL